MLVPPNDSPVKLKNKGRAAVLELGHMHKRSLIMVTEKKEKEKENINEKMKGKKKERRKKRYGEEKIKAKKAPFK